MDTNMSKLTPSRLFFSLLGITFASNVRRFNSESLIHEVAVITSNKLCGTPKFVGYWESLSNYPIFVGEAQGGMIGHDLVVMGGFHRGFATASNTTYALDVRVDNNNWRRMDDCPIPITHAAFAIHETSMYVCGGYLGGHPGPAVDDCFVYRHMAPRGTQWQRLPSLPAPRAGGGLTFDQTFHVLTFAGGSTRPRPRSSADAVDHNEVWMMAPHVTSVPYGGWYAQTNFPLFGNHLSFVTSRDGKNREHHYYLGGQVGEFEKNNNLDELYEYQPLTDQWLPRAKMPMARGHASSSTLPYGCGFLVAGGSVNGGYVKKRTDNVSFYQGATDTWTNVGLLYRDIKTPVCGIFDDTLYCTTGYSQQTMSRKLRIT